MDLQLAGKTALVTGSTSGIGFAVAKLLAAEGATVYINGRTEQSVAQSLRELKKNVHEADIKGIAADFSKIGDVNALIQQIPSVDILINNVGIFEPKHFDDIPDKDWFTLFEVNVMSGVRLARAYFSSMIKKGWGRIIFVSSESAIQIPEEMVHYGMTKTAQLAVSRGLAELTKGTDVTVNAVLPGPTKSDGAVEFLKRLAKQRNITAAEAEKEFFKSSRPTSLLQRFTSTDEVANMIVYLSSPLSSGTNGAALRVDGGVVKSMA